MIMGRIKKRIKIGRAKQLEVDALVDTASDFVMVIEEVLNDIDPPFSAGITRNVITAHGVEEKEIYLTNLKMDDCETPVVITLWKSLPDNNKVIVGNMALQTLGDVEIDMKNDTIQCKPRNAISGLFLAVGEGE
jgi:predicted aspartyl protease